MPVRLTPVRVRFTGAASAGEPGSVIDRDTRTTFSASGAFTLIFDFELPQTVAGLRVFGHPDATLSVACASGDSWLAVPALQGVRASMLAPGWSDLSAATPCSTSAVRVDVASEGGAAIVSEIEVWGAGTPVVPASPQTLRVISEPSLPWAFRSYDAGLAETTVEVSGVTARIEIPRPVSQLRRAYLLYDLKGLATWRGVPRRVNGRPTQGGALETPSLDWMPQIERINPDWLREGENEIAFLPSETAAPYEVRDVRLLVELDTGSNSIELATTPEMADMSRGVSPAVDGELATPWTPFPPGASPGTRSALTLSLDRAVEPASLGIILKSVPSGSIQVQAIDDLGGVRTLAARGGAELRAGWNVIPLDPGASASQLRIVLEAGAAGGWEPIEIVPLGSGVGGRFEPPSLTIVWPYQGEFAGREAVIRGFVTPDPAGLPVRVTIGPAVVDTTDGAFGATVSKDDVGFFDDADETPWTVGVQAVYAGGRTLTRTVRLTQALGGPHSIDGRLLGSRSFSVQPGQAKKIRHDEAGLDLEAGSVEHAKDLKITPLRDEDLPALDTGMTNVTKGPRRGYRFEPHGSRFAKQLRVSLPYDTSLLPEGMTESDVKTFYFDDQAGHWIPLDRVAVDPATKKVISLTDHFTDMINATLATPEHPELESHQPSVFAKVPSADPAEQIVLIDPPKAMGNGDAQLAYRLDLPDGRAGMKPDIALEYASSNGNGWLGLGWSLSSSAITLDTRWGAPRFDPALETETYALNGEQLTPLSHRGDLQARTTEKTFHFRREGRFLRIVRHGNAPTNYSWDVTDKLGVTSTYGGAIDSVLADDQGRISRWLLVSARDRHGNGIHYTYARVDDPGLPAGTVPGRQLYLERIDYTTADGLPGAYALRFVRDAELGEPRRPDVQIDARGGYKAVTSQLLRRVELTFQGAPVRSWELRYVRGAFEKSLLESITQRGVDGSVLATHRFAYHDDVRAGGAYVGFHPTETWATGEDGVRSAAVDEVASLFGSDAGRASGLSAYETIHAGGHLYVGYNQFAPTKQGSTGGKVGFTGTVRSQGLLAMADLNGDHLPDKVFKSSSGIFVRLNHSGPDGVTEFGPPIALDTLPALSEESTATVSFGAESYVGVSVIGNEATGLTTGLTYFADVNGDGLTDLVQGGTVLFNHLDENGVPTFDADSATSAVPVGPGTVDTQGVLPDLGAQLDRIRENAPLQDTVRRWVAPYAGQVRIAGDASLALPATPGTLDDGVRLTVQHNGSELWSVSIAAGDTTPYTPSGLDAVDVAKGDRIYFRVQSAIEGSHDVVQWDPE
ncbi:MAG TPA: SpvB/TcaC N-terminal domain-containing protein, partial [Candidatus Polarisedimenticolaceae bacterium]|nr:SpvB/TcaC N-terminal domain-containing protein [Candidatus Polarisedimenticolaceae bacterium]